MALSQWTSGRCIRHLAITTTRNEKYFFQKFWSVWHSWIRIEMLFDQLCAISARSENIGCLSSELWTTCDTFASMTVRSVASISVLNSPIDKTNSLGILTIFEVFKTCARSWMLSTQYSLSRRRHWQSFKQKVRNVMLVGVEMRRPRD